MGTSEVEPYGRRRCAFEGTVVEGFDTATVLPMSVGLEIQF